MGGELRHIELELNLRILEVSAVLNVGTLQKTKVNIIIINIKDRYAGLLPGFCQI